MTTLTLSYRELRIAVMAIHDSGTRCKRGCTFAERTAGNDLLDFAHKMDEFLAQSEPYHEFVMERHGTGQSATVTPSGDELPESTT